MVLDYIMSENETGQFILYNITGKLISTHQLNGRENKLFIVEDALKNGVYYYEIKIGDSIVFKNKVIIIH